MMSGPQRKIPVLVATLAALIACPSIRARQTGDFNDDGRVNLADIGVFTQWWLDSSCETPGCIADIDSKNGVNAVDFAYVAANWGKQEETLVISEFVASNGSNTPLGPGELLDEDGDSSDWIEIYNPTGALVSLNGWRLTNGNNNWRFPDGLTIDAGEFLIVFASGKDRAVPGANLHTDFELDADGEYLALLRPDDSVAHEYAPEYPRQVRDFSYGLSQYGETFVSSGAMISYEVPTPGDTGDEWTKLDFDDSGWQKTTTGLGFAPAPAETGQDIGTVQTPGSYSPDNGVYTITTDGKDIGGNADSFYFIHRPLPGDGYLIARVTAMTNADPWAKAGVMIRETLNPSSRFAAQMITSKYGAQFRSRVNTGGSTASTGGGRYNPPWWVRIERAGNQITGYLSRDGIVWSP